MMLVTVQGLDKMLDLKYIEHIIEKSAKNAGECHNCEDAKELYNLLLIIECDLNSLLDYIEKSKRVK